MVVELVGRRRPIRDEQGARKLLVRFGHGGQMASEIGEKSAQRGHVFFRPGLHAFGFGHALLGIGRQDSAQQRIRAVEDEVTFFQQHRVTTFGIWQKVQFGRVIGVVAFHAAFAAGLAGEQGPDFFFKTLRDELLIGYGGGSRR